MPGQKSDKKLGKKVVLIRPKIKTICLRKKAVLTREKLLNKKTLLNNYQDNYFLINSNSENLIHYAHCFECIFCYQSKTIKFC